MYQIDHVALEGSVPCMPPLGISVHSETVSASTVRRTAKNYVAQNYLGLKLAAPQRCRAAARR